VPDKAATIAEGLRSQIESCADEIDETRKLPDELVATLKQAGAFRLLIPRSLGGLETPLPEFLDTVQIYAEADASTAWCITQGAVIGTITGWLEPEAAEVIWQDPDAAIANGPPGKCVARDCGDHHRLTGRWGFSSGCRHATWMIGVAPLDDKSGWVSAFFPVDVPTFHDTWQVQGLRGTGSFEFSVEELKVERRWVANIAKPANHDGPFYRIPTGLVFAVSFASVALGVARAGLDATFAIAQGKVPRFTSTSLKNDGDVQKMMGEAEIRWRAGRAFLHDTVSKVWQALASQDRISKEQRIALRMAGTHVIREAAVVLDFAYTVMGSTSIYQNNPLQRRFQDLHVITQHVQARLSHYGYVGRHFLGHDYEPGPLS